MIHHISLNAKDSLHVADVLAEVLDGKVVPAPPNFPRGSWFVLSGDEHGTMLEVLPFGSELRPDEVEAGFHTDVIPNSSFVGAHAYVSVQRSAEELLAIGAREGWLTRVCDRGPFSLIECWIENRQMFEFATPEMTAQYVRLLTNPLTLRSALADLSEAQG